MSERNESSRASVQGAFEVTLRTIRLTENDTVNG